MDRKKIIYIGIILIITVMVSVTYFSYAFLAHNDEYNGRLNVVVGTLDYKLSSSLLDSNNSITLASNEKARLNIEIESLNEINSKYELFYTTDNNGIEIGYNTNNQLPTGTINTKAKKIVTVIIKNATSSSATITFGVQGGFTHNTLVLEVGKTSIGALQSSYCEVATNTIYNFDYNGTNGTNGSIQEYNVPCSGTYKLETWGAQGGSNGATGGKGGYEYGTFNLNVNDISKLYIGVGGQGQTATNALANGGYNGGGQAKGVYTQGQNHIYKVGAGGGATHIAINNNRGLLWQYINNKDEILIVAGGGGGTGGCKDCTIYNGGTGGGTTGGNGTDSWLTSGKTATTGSYGAQGGTQTRQGIGRTEGGFGYGANSTCNGGAGAGWYGGSTGTYGSGGGGSGYVNTTYLVSGTSGATNGNRAGNGYARITYVSESTKEEKVKIGYFITYNTNNGTLDKDYGIVIPGNQIGTLPTPVKEDKYFEGWYLEDTFTTRVDNTYIPTSDIILYARYGIEVDLNLSGRTASVPSNTNGVNTTNRTFDYNTYIVGLSTDNYYYPSRIASYTYGNNSISVTLTASTAAGYGIALPVKLDQGDYLIKCDENYNIGIGYFKSGGVYQSYTYATKFNISSTIDSITLTFIGGYPNSRIYSNIQLYKLD